jgi:protein associated with RNAse G/E
MGKFISYKIKSFKHNGHLHRMWMENWLVPPHSLISEHAQESMMVFINNQTKIQEADGKEWVSRIPGVSFFIPKQWYNIVALLEGNGIRYYCNVASPAYCSGNVITYIDYDLDVIVMPNGNVQIVDQEEFEQHKSLYNYSDIVVEKAEHGLQTLLQRIRGKKAPFHEDTVRFYYNLWKHKGMECRE